MDLALLWLVKQAKSNHTIPGFAHCSQSPQILLDQGSQVVDCFALDNIIVATSKDGETTLQNLPAEQYQQWLEDDYLLSDIWLKTPVGGS